ncbi:MAG: glycosyltransferase family 25 protein [Akkermansiaceae bacterium]|nr:glycosyltransferase family 25 protein [Verrucomicrobiales bacterium]
MTHTFSATSLMLNALQLNETLPQKSQRLSDIRADDRSVEAQSIQTYVINLDRHQQRLDRMKTLLEGFSFRRIPAIDGHRLQGPETNGPVGTPSEENVSRFALGCALSHRGAWTEFLHSGSPHACILEDDVHLSPDFARFIQDNDWIPPEVDLLKIETYSQRVSLSRRIVTGLDRSIALLCSRHFGTAGYILSRKGAEALLRITARIDRPLDHLLFGKAAVDQLLLRHQLFPALCTQSKHDGTALAFPEMESAIQDSQPRRKEAFLSKMRSEVIRPFRQAKKLVSSVTSGRFLQERTCVVPFA